MAEIGSRRPIKQRSSGWARWAAARLAEADASPDLISAASAAVSLLGAALLVWAGSTAPGALRAALFVAAGACLPLRLVCNLLDGMVAVEHGRGASAGPIWNELPDRFSDVVVLVAAGYAARSSGLALGASAGWICAVLALSTAYVRELGHGLGFAPDFSGPFAKQQRMLALTAAAAVSAVEPLWGWRGQSMLIALGIVGLGTALTTARRTRTLAIRLAERAGQQEKPGGNP